MTTPSLWPPQDYIRPISLVCVGNQAELDTVYAPWRDADNLNLEIRLCLLREPAQLLAGDIVQLVQDRPYALLAHRAAVDVVMSAVTSLAETGLPISVFVAGAAPRCGAGWAELDRRPLIHAIAGRADDDASPGAMAEWRNWAPGRFSLQVIDGGADFLREHGSEILESIHLDLGAMHYYVPGRGFVDVATESVITTEVAR